MPKFFILSENGPKIFGDKRGSVSDVPEFVARQPAFLAKHRAALTDADIESITDYVEPPPPPPPPPPVILSKLKIRRQLREWGKEAIFDMVLDAIPHARTDWDDSQQFSPNDPLFSSNKEAFKAALELTEEQFQTLMTA